MSVTSFVGSSATVGGASGGYTYAYNNIAATPSQVLPGDPQRRAITFHNPGAVNLYVSQSVVQNTGSDVPLSPNPSALGGCYLLAANGGWLTFDGECQKPWQAFSIAGSGNPLTVKVSRT